MTSKNPAETETIDAPGESATLVTPDTAEASAALDPLDALTSPAEVEEGASTREIDPRIKVFVDRGQERTEAAPRKWSYVTLPEAEVKRVTRDAKRYARATGRTFRVKHSDNPNRLVYRVIAKVVKADE